MSGNRAKEEAIDYLLEHGGALVGSSACSEIEIADARVHGRMWVTDGGLGIVARLPKWLAIAHERSDKAMKAMLVLALLVLPAWAGAQTDPRTQPLAQPGSLVYVGQFKVPDTDGVSWQIPHQFTGGSIGAAGVAGPGQLFFGCNSQSNATLGVVSVPAIGGVAKVVTPCTQMPNYQAMGTDPSERRIGGAMVINGRVVVSGFIFYDGGGAQSKTHWWGPSLATMSGPALVQAQNVRLGADAHYPKAGMIAGWMGAIPTEWQPLLGAPAFTGQGALAITARSSFGPSLSLFDPAALGTADPVAATMLVGYPEEHQTLGPWGPTNGAWRGPKVSPYYTGADMLAGMFWMNNTRSILAVGRHGLAMPEMNGDICYGPGTPDPALIDQPDGAGNHYCYDPSDKNKGPHAYKYVPQVLAYDALDFLAVKTGAKKPWDVKPYAAWNFAVGTPLDKPGIKINGAAYDTATGRLYVTAGWTDVYVFESKTGAPPPPPPPPPPPTPVDCQGVWSESLSEPTPLVCDAADPFQTRIRTKTFTVTTPPANGGQACPASPVVTTEKTACTPLPPPPPPPTPTFVGAIRAQATGSYGLRVTLEVSKAQAIPPKGAAVDVPLPAGVVVHGTVYSIGTYANGNWRLVVTLPNTSALTLGVEIPVAPQ